MRRVVPALLAALLLLQWGAAYGHCHALHALATELPGWTICTAHGTDQTPATPDDALRADWDCPACHQVPVIGAVPPPLPRFEAVAWHPAPAPAPHLPVATLGPRAPPPPARAPPHLA